MLDVAAETRKRRRAEEEAKKNAKEGVGGAGGGDSGKNEGGDGAASKKSAVDKTLVEREKRTETMKQTNVALSDLTALLRKRRTSKASAPPPKMRPRVETSPIKTPVTPLKPPTDLSSSSNGATGSEKKNGGKASLNGNNSSAATSKSVNRHPMTITNDHLTLRDCLYFLEHERVSRKGDLILKWYSRLENPWKPDIPSSPSTEKTPAQG